MMMIITLLPADIAHKRHLCDNEYNLMNHIRHSRWTRLTLWASATQAFWWWWLSHCCYRQILHINSIYATMNINWWIIYTYRHCSVNQPTLSSQHSWWTRLMLWATATQAFRRWWLSQIVTSRYCT